MFLKFDKSFWTKKLDLYKKNQFRSLIFKLLTSRICYFLLIFFLIQSFVVDFFYRSIFTFWLKSKIQKFNSCYKNRHLWREVSTSFFCEHTHTRDVLFFRTDQLLRKINLFSALMHLGTLENCWEYRIIINTAYIHVRIDINIRNKTRLRFKQCVIPFLGQSRVEKLFQ